MDVFVGEFQQQLDDSEQAMLLTIESETRKLLEWAKSRSA